MAFLYYITSSGRAMATNFLPFYFSDCQTYIKSTSSERTRQRTVSLIDGKALEKDASFGSRIGDTMCYTY